MMKGLPALMRLAAMRLFDHEARGSVIPSFLGKQD
jgi:hypothetical protein